jgi:hypothetical protein
LVNSHVRSPVAGGVDVAVWQSSSTLFMLAMVETGSTPLLGAVSSAKAHKSGPKRVGWSFRPTEEEIHRSQQATHDNASHGLM